MSLLKAIKAQLGLSNTPANNFVITAEADNGTLKLARGNAGANTQDILTVDAAGKVVFPQNAQTWQDVKASRSSGTTFTNTTPWPIKVSVTMATGGTFGSIAVTVGGVSLGAAIYNAGSGNATVTQYFEVPAGATYVVTFSTTITTWVELR